MFVSLHLSPSVLPRLFFLKTILKLFAKAFSGGFWKQIWDSLVSKQDKLLIIHYRSGWFTHRIKWINAQILGLMLDSIKDKSYCDMTIFIHIFVLSIHFQAKRLNLDNVCFHFPLDLAQVCIFLTFLSFSKSRAFKSYVIYIFIEWHTNIW